MKILLITYFRIIYRDLKPENVGIDAEGNVKLFDFGLAKKLRLSDELSDGTYILTGKTGSMRYMAPEVHKSKPYNLSADVYALAMLCWEVLSMEKPFESYSTTMHMDLVVVKGYRPKCDAKWPAALQCVLKESWSKDPKTRPEAAEITNVLRSFTNQAQEYWHATEKNQINRRVTV